MTDSIIYDINETNVELMEPIITGSTNEQKLMAVRMACSELKIEPLNFLKCKTHSGQNEQPMGFDQTYSGALARAQQAREQHPEAIAIGIESGIFRFVHNSVTLDIAVIVILTPDNREIVTTSTGIKFPEEHVRKAKERGFKTVTVGQIIHEKKGGDKSDPHSMLTDGKVSRTETLVDGLKIALKQL